MTRKKKSGRRPQPLGGRRPQPLDKTGGSHPSQALDNKSGPRPPDKTEWLICCGIFITTLIVYISTLAPTVYFGDGGELTAAAYNLGVAHPPGYPLYLLLGKLFMMLVPLSSIAMRMNLLSAVFASASVVMVYLIGRTLNHQRLPAVLTALIAAFSFTFWTQAVVAEVYTLAALFFLVMIFQTLTWLETKSPRRLMFLALTAGLALTHHVIIALFFPVFLVFILWNQPDLIKKPDWRRIGKIIALFLLPLLLYLYLPIRSAANPPNDWGNPETLSAAVDHIAAKQFGGLFLKHGLDGLMFQLKTFFNALLKQFPFFLFLLTAGGIFAGWKRWKKTVLLFLALALVGVCYSTAYFITDIEAHFIYIFLGLTLLMGFALDRLFSHIQKVQKAPVYWVGAAALIVIALLPFGFNRAECDRSSNYLARNYGQNMLRFLDMNGVLFIDGEAELFPVTYLKIVENLRPDVEVYDVRQNIFPIPPLKDKKVDEASMEIFQQFIREKVKAERPVYFTNPIFENLRYRDYGVLSWVMTAGAPPGGMLDPWDQYNLSGLEGLHLDADARETAGKYYLSRAKYLSRTNQREPSDQFLEKAVAVAHDRPRVLKHVGVFYMQSGRREQAETLVKKAADLFPFDPDVYNMLGMASHYRLDYTAALAHYDKSLGLMKDNISALVNRAMLYEQLGDREADAKKKKGYYQKAYNDLLHSEEIQPSNLSISRLRIRVNKKIPQ